jgi:hypothetical protein
MKIKLIIKCAFILAITSFSWNNIFAQCMHQISHTSGTTNINGVQVTVLSSGDSDTTTMCVDAQPYIIGWDYNPPHSDGSYTFQFSPPIDSLILNFSALNGSNSHKEIIKINVNGSHYSIPVIGSLNTCSNSLAVLTTSGDLTGQIDGSQSGCNGVVIAGPISEITLIDSVVTGEPNGTIFSLFICSEFPTSVFENYLPDLLIYPIPSKKEITIEGLIGRNIEIKLFDLFGRIFYVNHLIQDSKTMIDVSDFPNGIYYLSITVDGNLVTRKVIVAKN